MKIGSYAEFQTAYDETPDDTPLTKFVESYYNEEAGQGADPAFVWIYRMKIADTGGTVTDQVAIPGDDLTQWGTGVAPVESITTVKVSYDGATPVSQVGGFDVEVDVNGLKTGMITFKTGFPKDVTVTYKAISLATDTVYITYTTSGIAAAFKIMASVDIQLVAFAYDHGKMTGATPAVGIYGGVSLVDDFQKLVAYVNQAAGSGYYRQAILSLPANAVPGDTATTYGATTKWQDLRGSDIGFNDRATIVAFKQSLATSGYKGEFDGAAVMAALIRKNSVSVDVGYTANTTAIQAYEDLATQWAFKNARIGTIVKDSHLVDGSWLNFGFTCGLDINRWINIRRCKDQIKHLIEARLMRLLLSKPGVKYTAEGGYKIINTIGACVETAKMNGWCLGLVSCVIPIMPYLTKNNRSTQDQLVVDNAVESGIWSGINLSVRMFGNTEQINLAPIVGVLG